MNRLAQGVVFAVLCSACGPNEQATVRGDAGGGGAGGGGAGGGGTPATCGQEVTALKELMLVDPTVITDARASNATNGVWSFRHLITQLTPPGAKPEEFVEAFLQQWVTVTEVSGRPVATRAGAASPPHGMWKVINAWPKTADGHLDLALAPFRLLAIVNRLDLRDASKPAGEGRFVFGYAKTSGAPDQGRMTIIFEFNLPTTGARGLSAAAWGRAWHELGTQGFGAGLNDKLEAITRRFTDRGADGAPTLSQLRSSENLLGVPWEFREFKIGADGALRQAVVADTPDSSLNISTDFNDWAAQNEAAIRAGTFELPTRFAGASSQSFPPNVTWTLGNRLPEDARRAFAMKTCNGCHSAKEAGVADIFYHVTPVAQTASADNRSSLSDFVKDVELPARTEGLKALLCVQ